MATAEVMAAIYIYVRYYVLYVSKVCRTDGKTVSTFPEKDLKLLCRGLEKNTV